MALRAGGDARDLSLCVPGPEATANTAAAGRFLEAVVSPKKGAAGRRGQLRNKGEDYEARGLRDQS